MYLPGHYPISDGQIGGQYRRYHKPFSVDSSQMGRSLSISRDYFATQKFRIGLLIPMQGAAGIWMRLILIALLAN